MARKLYRTVGMGGTFDHLHKGHESFLRAAAELGEFVMVGVTEEKLTKHKAYAKLIQPYPKRVHAVQKFLSSLQVPHQVVSLSDPYGPTIDPDVHIDALVVTEATIAGADKINTIRSGLQLRELPVHVHKMVLDDSGTILAAERIRQGIVNRAGVVYKQLFTQDFQLNKSHRSFFQSLHGKIVEEPNKSAGQTIVVGDATLERFVSFAWPLDLAMYDGHTQRQPLQNLPTATATLQNPAGQITTQLVEWLEQYFVNTYQQPQLLHVEGEEDLATVAAVLVAPLGTMIYFGQPNQGMVELQVTEKRKDLFYQALTQ